MFSNSLSIITNNPKKPAVENVSFNKIEIGVALSNTVCKDDRIFLEASACLIQHMITKHILTTFLSHQSFGALLPHHSSYTAVEDILTLVVFENWF